MEDQSPLMPETEKTRKAVAPVAPRAAAQEPIEDETSEPGFDPAEYEKLLDMYDVSFRNFAEGEATPTTSRPAVRAAASVVGPMTAAGRPAARLPAERAKASTAEGDAKSARSKPLNRDSRTASFRPGGSTGR